LCPDIYAIFLRLSFLEKERKNSKIWIIGGMDAEIIVINLLD